MKNKIIKSHYNPNYYQSHYNYLLNDYKYYELLAKYWKYAIFEKLNINICSNILDYGCGLGQVTAALPYVTYYDPSEYSISFLRHKGKTAISELELIPEHSFDYIICSHSLEHSPTPKFYLESLHKFLKNRGKLLLILPVEKKLEKSLIPDDNQHFLCWTFQTITNLLYHCDWCPVYQSLLFNPFMLKTLGSRISSLFVIKVAYLLGKIKRSYPSLLILAEQIIS